MYRIICTVIITLSLINLVVSSHAAERVPVISVSGLNVEPYIIQSKTRHTPPSGIVIDIVDLLFHRLDYQADYHISVWARAYREVTNGQTAALIPAMKTPERELLLWYPSEPLLTLNMYLFKAKENDGQWDGTIDSLKGAKIASIRGGKVTPEFDKAVSEGIIFIEDRTNFELVMKAAAAQRASYAVVDKMMGLWAAKKSGVLKQVELSPPLLGKTPVYIAFSKEDLSPEFKKKINEELINLKKEGKIQQIIDKYLEKVSF